MEAQVAAVEDLLGRLEALDDPAARELALEAVRGLVALYGAALARIMATVSSRSGPTVLARLAEDALVGHLLMLHELHPLDLASRVRGALDEVRPFLRSHGGEVELLGIERGVARVRLAGSCRGCPSSAATLRGSVEAAIRRAAPELEGIEAEEAGADQAPPAALVQLGGSPVSRPETSVRA